MRLTPFKINTFLLTKLPAAYLCGVRLKKIDNQQCRTTVTHRWINQNPFRSMYFAVQCMAAELSTGALVMQKITESNRKISMLVGTQKGTYLKKATGKITFTCTDGQKIAETIQQAIATGEGQEVVLKSVGINQQEQEVSHMEFTWLIKVKDN